MELAQKAIVPQVRAPVTIPNFSADPQAQTSTCETSARIQGPAPLPTSQPVFIHQPLVNISPPAVPVGPTYVDVPTIQAPPMISVPMQPIVSTVLSTASPNWLHQQMAISSSCYLPAQSVAPPMTIGPQLYVSQRTCAHLYTDHQSGSDQHMDITDEGGGSWMRPSGFGEAPRSQNPPYKLQSKLL
jgi:hypothetical protein